MKLLFSEVSEGWCCGLPAAHRSEPPPTRPTPAEMNADCTNCSQVADLAFASMYSLIFAAGLPLNLVALCIFAFGGAGRSITTTYMKNLAISDLLLLLSLPLRVWYYTWRPQLPQPICEAAGMLLLVNMYGSLFLLACISWDRCMAVCFPLRPWAQAMRQQAKCICTAVWVLSFAGTIPTYFVHMADRKNSTLCFDGRPRYIASPGVSCAMVLAFALPLTVMVTCSCRLLQAVQQSGAVQMELVNETKIQHMVVTNVAIFLGCFLPYHVAVLCYQVPELKGDRLDRAYQCTLLLACANATLDPFAYYFATETFQHLVAMDRLFRGRDSHSNNVGGAELVAQPLRAQSLSALMCDEQPFKVAEAAGAGQL
ncbi:lysophosphatidic acid receptor 6-like [Rhineura floridana]|uniref:lysophosphatidic acid receptor 6-like n=1 Tax=Rhineura floridana TaxID=261503 RepID=UPI002AC80D03|nr:lysophosphatidic acid receptor 6-like [Rhineura floridana]